MTAVAPLAEVRSGASMLELDNGLRAAFLPDLCYPVASVTLSVVAGSAADPVEKSGLAHLGEHLAYAGVHPIYGRRFPGWIRRARGTTAAFTSVDRTVFSQLLPPEQVGLGLWLQSQRLRYGGAELKSDVVARERQVILEERRQQVLDRPYGDALEQLFSQVFPQGHPYHAPPMGKTEGLQRLTVEDAGRFLDRWLVPRKGLLVVAGRFEVGRVRGQVERLFGDLKAGRKPSMEPPREPSSRTTSRKHVRRRVPAPQLLHGFLLPGEGSEAWRRAVVLAAALNAVWPATERPRGRGIEAGVQHFRALVLGMRWQSVLVLEWTASPGGTGAELEAAARRYRTALLEKSQTAAQVQAARASCRRTLAGLWDRLDQRTDLLARWDLRGESATCSSEMERLAGVSSQDLAGFVESTCGTGQGWSLLVESQEARR